MFNVEASSKPINKNNGQLSTLEDFSKNKKEGFQSATAWLDYGYAQHDIVSNASRASNVDKIINSQVKPLIKQHAQWKLDADKVTDNYASIVSNYDKMVLLRDQLNENPPFETRTVEVGPSMPGRNVKIIDVPNVDMSYQRVVVVSPVNSTNEGSAGAAQDGGAYPSGDVFTVTVNSKTLTVTKIAPTNSSGAVGAWSHNLKINIKVENIPDKKYFHHKDDWEFGDKRKSQREQHMGDTKELLLYTNQFYIIGSITTALTLIFAYKHYG
jgi:hypothetical protein